MKNRHHLKVIVIVPTSPPDGTHNSRGVKKSIEKHCCTHTCPGFYCCVRHLVALLELLQWLLNDDTLSNVKQLEIRLHLFYAPWFVLRKCALPLLACIFYDGLVAIQTGHKNK
jgi:hypothetical protein